MLHWMDRSAMPHPSGESSGAALRLDFDRRLKLEFHGSKVTSDADRLGHDPAMRWVVGSRAMTREAAFTSQMGRFETEALTDATNLAALADLSGQGIDTVHARRPTTTVVLDLNSSVSETDGEQEGTVCNGHFGCTCYHPRFVFNQFGDLGRCALRPGNVHSTDGWRAVFQHGAPYQPVRRNRVAASHLAGVARRKPSPRHAGRTCHRSRPWQ